MTRYIATTTHRNGRDAYVTFAYETREEAARAAFDGDGKARTCRTCRAHLSVSHGYVRGFEIHWHKREDLA